MTLERAWNIVLAFYGGDPVVAWLLTFALCFVLAALLTFRRWRAHEEQKAAPDSARSLKAAFELTERPWPAPPGPKGFRDGRQRPNVTGGPWGGNAA